MDLLFVVDGSRSVGQQNFNDMKTFLKRVVDVTDVSGDTARIAVIQFNENPYPEFSFNSFRNENSVKGKI